MPKRYKSGGLNLAKARLKSKKDDTRPTTDEKRDMLPHLRDLRVRSKKHRGAVFLKPTGVQKIVSPQKLILEWNRKQASIRRIKRIARSPKKFKNPPSSELVLVVRVRGNRGLDSVTKQTLDSLRLQERHTCVFHRLTPELFQDLKTVEPFVAWGVPTKKTIHDLIFKRGYIGLKTNYANPDKILSERSRNDRFDWDKEKKFLRVKLCDNQVVEKHLGLYDIICVEDIIHEIHSVGPFFDKVNQLLAPFYLIPSPGRGLIAAKKQLFNRAKHLTTQAKDKRINKFVRWFC